MTRRGFLGLLTAPALSLAAPRWVWQHAGFRGGFDCGLFDRRIRVR